MTVRLTTVCVGLCLLVAAGTEPRAAGAEGLDRYGGYRGVALPGTGYFRLEKVGDQWWAVTPEGHPYFMLGIGAVNLNSGVDRAGKSFQDHVQEKYAAAPEGHPDAFGSDWKARWGYYARVRLRDWGFNHLGTFSFFPAAAKLEAGDVAPPPMGGMPDNRMPQVVTNRAGRDSMGADRTWRVKNLYGPVRTKVTGSNPYFPDVFDPRFRASQEAAAAVLDVSIPWVVYVFMDQTDEMRGVNAGHPHLGFVSMATNFAMAADPNGFLGAQSYADARMYTKYAARDFLREKYQSLDALNLAWGTSYTSWESDGGWGVGTGVLDEDGRGLGPQWGKEAPEKSGYPAVRGDLDQFAAAVMRRWYQTVYEAFKGARVPYILATNNLENPKDYVYEGLRALDGATVFADLVVAQDPEAGQWSDVLNRPFSAWNLDGYFTAENDSPVGYVGTVDRVAFDDAAKTVTITCDSCNFHWAGDPAFNPVHYLLTTFSCLPSSVAKGTTLRPQYYRSTRDDWKGQHEFVVREYSYFNGTYAELKAAIRVGDTFRRVVDMNRSGPFQTQAARASAYASQLEAAVTARSPRGVYFNVGAHFWAFKDNTFSFWEVYNFGLVTHQENPYNGRDACFANGVDDYGFVTKAESRPTYLTGSCFGNFLGPVRAAHGQVYGWRPSLPKPSPPSGVDRR